MPTYDYVCRACGHELEVFQSISAPARKRCPRCRKARLERRIGTGAGFLFKGQGFYQTDYRSDAYEKARSAEKSAETGADAGTGAAAAAPKAAEPEKKPAAEPAGDAPLREARRAPRARRRKSG